MCLAWHVGPSGFVIHVCPSVCLLDRIYVSFYLSSFAHSARPGCKVEMLGRSRELHNHLYLGSGVRTWMVWKHLCCVHCCDGANRFNTILHHIREMHSFFLNKAQHNPGRLGNHGRSCVGGRSQYGSCVLTNEWRQCVFVELIFGLNIGPTVRSNKLISATSHRHEKKHVACSLLHALPRHNWDHGGWMAKNVASTVCSKCRPSWIKWIEP